MRYVVVLFVLSVIAVGLHYVADWIDARWPLHDDV